MDVDKVCGVLSTGGLTSSMARLRAAVEHLRKEGVAVMQDERIALTPPTNSAKVVDLKTGRGA